MAHPPAEWVWEVVKALLALSIGALAGQAQAFWKRFQASQAALAEVRAGQVELLAEIRKTASSLQKLRHRLQVRLGRQDVRIARMEERIRALLRGQVTPAEAARLEAEWAHQEELDRTQEALALDRERHHDTEDL